MDVFDLDHSLVEDYTRFARSFTLVRKGAKPGSARYDAQQGAEERHGFDNLILLCGRHHTVIDHDEEAYTVERLANMKADHESQAILVGEDFADPSGPAPDQPDRLISKSVGRHYRTHHQSFHGAIAFAERQIEALMKLGDDFRKVLEHCRLGWNR